MNDFEVMEKRKAEGKLFTDTLGWLKISMQAKNLVHKYNKTSPLNLPKRMRLVKKIFGSVGKNTYIESPIHLCSGKNISIGSKCYFNFNSTFIDDYKITIGNGVMFGPNVTVCTTGHPVHIDLRRNGEMYCAPVQIKDNVWIGANAVILPGVTIGENSVIGAGSVVTKDIPANVVAIGSPCKVMRAITDIDKDYYYKELRVDDEWKSGNINPSIKND